MSHQDQGRCNGSVFHFQALKAAIGWLWNDVDFSDLKLRDDCTWSVPALATAALLWSWSDELTLGDRFRKARQIACKSLGIRRAPATSYQAFLKLLNKWTPRLVELLRHAFRRRMKRHFPRRLRIAGFFAFGADGSRIEAPRTSSNEAAYSTRTNHSGKKKRNLRKHSKRPNKWDVDTTQLWLTTLWHLGTQLPWSWRLGPCDSSERDHLSEMLGELPKDSLMVIDAGFYGYHLWHDMLAAGCQFVARVGSNVHLLKKLAYTRQRGNIVYCWPVREARRRQPPLTLRLVVLKGNRHPVYLVTSVLSAKRLSRTDVARLYERRWGIEVFYRDLKQTFDRRKLRSRNAANAYTEAQWSLLGLWAMALHAQYYQQAQKLDPSRLSCAGMLRAYRRAMREYKSRPEVGEDLSSMLRIAIKDDYQRTKPKTNLDYPRKRAKRPPRKPRIRNATKWQVTRAKQLKKRGVKIGLTA
jgi:hypothetical protein